MRSHQPPSGPVSPHQTLLVPSASISPADPKDPPPPGAGAVSPQLGAGGSLPRGRAPWLQGGGPGGALEASGWWVTQRLSDSSTDSSPPRRWPSPSPLPTPLRGCATLAWFYGQDGMVLRARNAGRRGRGREQLQGPSVTPNQPNLPRREADGRFPGRGDPGGAASPVPVPRTRCGCARPPRPRESFSSLPWALP